jgi:hypothetical protein
MIRMHVCAPNETTALSALRSALCALSFAAHPRSPRNALERGPLANLVLVQPLSYTPATWRGAMPQFFFSRRRKAVESV